MIRSTCSIVAVLAVVLLLLPSSALAQITTGTVTGRITDSTGASIPGARVVLISEARGTRSAAVNTNAMGDYVIPNVIPDTYTLEVTFESFKTSQRAGIEVSGGDRIGVPAIALEIGETVETVTVSSEAPLVQTQSGERSFAISNEQIESLPVDRGNFTSMVMFTPGVNSTLTRIDASGSRLGGASQDNVMMDGISAMDTGNNGQMLRMNIESIGEVKIVTQGYQAEYGRSSGLQITAVTKNGTNEFHGSAYGVFTDSDWDKDRWDYALNGQAISKTDQQIWGYTIGGPVVIPKVINGRNKLFFFYAHEFTPSNSGGGTNEFRMPTLAERAGDFSQSLDNNGDPIPALYDYTTGQAFDGNIIPSNRLYAPGVAALKRYPEPNHTQVAGENYNWSADRPTYADLRQQPAVRIDYQVTSKLQVNGKYSGQRLRRVTRPGTIPGFNDVYQPKPYITNYGITANYMINPMTYITGTYGRIQNDLAGGGSGGILLNPESNRLNSMADFPLLYPDAGIMPERSYGYSIMEAEQPPSWDGTRLNLPPLFGWGSRIGAAPPNHQYPGWLNINRTQDVNISMTHITGRHTIKGGYYLNHSYKAQNTGAGGIANLHFQGYVDFGNNTNNTLDTGFGYGNAALGVFTQYMQQSKFVEGSMIYNQHEAFIQDNWKVSNRLTLDYGMRFVHQVPQADQFQQMSNFFWDQFDVSQAQTLYVAGCSDGSITCSGDDRNAMDPRTGEILVVQGAKNTAAAIGTPIPNSGDPLMGIEQAGVGIVNTNYKWPWLVVAPRFGFAYDVTGNSDLVLRGGFGLFYDRPDGNTVFSTPANPPIATLKNLYNGELATLGQGGLSLLPVPNMVTFQYEADVPSSWQWQGGFQKTLPGAMALDVMYVGNHGYNRMGAFQGQSRQLINSVDLGAAYLPENQDPTLGTSDIPGANAYTTNLLRPYQGLGAVEENATLFWDTYHSMQVSLNRRFRSGISFGFNYTYGISLKGNTGIVQRFEHAADGTLSVRSDQDAYEKLMEDLDRRPHMIKGNFIWNSPGISGAGAVVRELTRDWQIGTVLTAGSGQAYTPTFRYNRNGSNVNITGSPDYAGRIIVTGDPGKGYSDDQYAQFNALAFKGAGYGSLGLESGRNYLREEFTKLVDLSVTRRIRLGSEKYRMELRADVYNLFNTVIITQLETRADFNSPTDMTLRNNQFNADGSLNQSRLTPRSAGFGAAERAADMREVQLQLRFEF